MAKKKRKNKKRTIAKRKVVKVVKKRKVKKATKVVRRKIVRRKTSRKIRKSKKVQRKKTVRRKQKPKTHRKRFIPVGGMGLTNGVMMRTAHYMAIALDNGNGNAEISPFELKKPKREYKFFSWPVIRGIVLLVQMLMLFVRTSFHKRKFIKARLKQHPRHKRLFIRLSQYILYLIYFLLFVGFFDYIFQNIHGWPNNDFRLFIYNLIFTFLYLVVFFLLFGLVSVGSRDEMVIFAYHGAEHKIMNAYERGKPLTLDNVRKESTLHPRCGSIVAFWSLVILAILLVLFNWKNYNWALNFLVSLGLVFLSFSVAYEWVRFLIIRRKKWLYDVFIKPIFLFQSLVVREPTKNQLEIGLAALDTVLKLEKER